jgi:hypothetical protein
VPLICPNAIAQNTTAFDPTTKFTVPIYNGVFSFAEGGNYSKATFEDNAWFFMNLYINGSKPLANLEFSAKNCNVTIYNYETSILGFPSDRISYNVRGEGEQTVNMGVGVGGGASVNWVVFSNRTFVSNGWSVSHNGTVTVTGLTGNVTVIYFGFTSDLGNSNLPFYEQHSVAIAVTVAVGATVAATVVVKVAAKRQAEKGELTNNGRQVLAVSESGRPRRPRL